VEDGGMLAGERRDSKEFILIVNVPYLFYSSI
jgi:hypothetical protein